jgi:hypothetical protein
MPHVPVELTSLESFNISGRGTIYTVDLTKMEPGRKLLVNDVIKLDGQLVRIRFIEQFAFGPERQNKTAGIGVKPYE